MTTKIFVSRALAVLAVMLLGLSSVSLAQQRRAITVGAPKALPFNDGVLVGNTLYIAGTEGVDDSGKLKPGGIAAETGTTLDNMGKVLKAAGFEWADVVAVTVYLADLRDYAEMNKVYRSILPDPKPARATVQVAGLVNNARVEISAVAVKDTLLRPVSSVETGLAPSPPRSSPTRGSH
jgi:2-iminobutanoate/2-iminopropanoate deaminase